MRRLARKLAQCCVAGVMLLVLAAQAHAGFLTSTLDFDSADGNLTTASVLTESSKPAPEPQAEQPPRKSPQQHIERDALATQNTSMSGTGGTVSNTVSSPLAALPQTHPAGSSRQLIAYRLTEPHLQLPVPFLDGVFRPPKQLL